MESRLLDWDSKFFSFPVARMEGTIDMATGLEKLMDKGVKLVYYSCSPADVYANECAKDNGGILVDTKRTYRRDSIKFPHNSKVVLWGFNFPTPEMVSLAIQSGIYSRYNTDPKIGKSKFEQMYKLWIVNSVNHKIADQVFVYTNSEGIVIGLITLAFKDGYSDIGIIATDEKYRGKGIGTALVERALTESAKRNLPTQVVTQAANVPACSLYLKCGFDLIDEQNFYHFHL